MSSFAPGGGLTRNAGCCYPRDNMPRRPDAHLAYWLDERGVLHGYPETHRLPPRPVVSGEPESRLGADAVVTLEDATWQDRLDDSSGGRCVLAWRDRQGFRWERRVGLNDYVSLADGAQLLGVPLMRVHRWTRTGGPLKTKVKKRKGYAVVRVRDLYELAVTLQIKVPRGRPRGLIGLSEESNEELLKKVRSERKRGR